MAQKKKQRRFSVVKAVKELARERVGPVRPVRKAENTKRSRKEKHKATLGKLLQEKD